MNSRPPPTQQEKDATRPNSKTPPRPGPPKQQQKKTSHPSPAQTEKNKTRTPPQQQNMNSPPAQTAKNTHALGRGGCVFIFCCFGGGVFFAVWAGPAPPPKQQKIKRDPAQRAKKMTPEKPNKKDQTTKLLPLQPQSRFPKIWGNLFGGPHNKDCTIFGSILGSPYCGKLPLMLRQDSSQSSTPAGRDFICGFGGCIIWGS